MRDADPHDLQRFVRAQDEGGTYDRALGELRGGRKRSHWMWFVFPQLAGLGRSATARQFAIRSLTEAQAYLAHPVLGSRLDDCVTALPIEVPGTSAVEVFGEIDAQKLCSSMTLFECAAGEDGARFAAVVRHWFDDRPDARTLELLEV